MARIDFTKPTKLQLGIRVNYKCVYPGCDRVTHGPRRDLGKVISIGVAAHDAPASPGGPRGEAPLTPEQIKAYENGAWLCAYDATLVDRDPVSFPLGTLPRWQNDAERRTSDAVYLAPINTYAGTSEVCAKLKVFLASANDIRLTLYVHNRENTVLLREEVTKMSVLINRCSGPQWAPDNPMHSLHRHTAAIQSQAINCLQSIVSEVTNRTRWTLCDYGHEYFMKKTGPYHRACITPEQEQSVNLIYNCYERYQQHLEDLRKYAKGEGHNIYSTF